MDGEHTENQQDNNNFEDNDKSPKESTDSHEVTVKHGSSTNKEPKISPIDRLDGTVTSSGVGHVSSSIDSKSRLNQIKKYFMYIMIGGFVVSALISIVAILVGEFNEVIAKSLFTTMAIVIHSLVTVGFMSIEHKSGGDEVVLNTLFGVTAVSLLASVLGIWDVIKAQTVADLYQASFYAVIASFVIRFIMRANRRDKVTRLLANTTIGVTIFTYLLIMPAVFVNYPDTLPEFYQRLMWATVILQVTLAVLVSIFNRLYLNQHPELNVSAGEKPRVPTAVKVIIFILCIPLFISILGWLMNVLFYRPYY